MYGIGLASGEVVNNVFAGKLKLFVVSKEVGYSLAFLGVVRRELLSLQEKAFRALSGILLFRYLLVHSVGNGFHTIKLGGLHNAKISELAVKASDGNLFVGTGDVTLPVLVPLGRTGNRPGIGAVHQLNLVGHRHLDGSGEVILSGGNGSLTHAHGLDIAIAHYGHLLIGGGPLQLAGVGGVLREEGRFNIGGAAHKERHLRLIEHYLGGGNALGEYIHKGAGRYAVHRSGNAGDTLCKGCHLTTGINRSHGLVGRLPGHGSSLSIFRLEGSREGNALPHYHVVGLGSDFQPLNLCGHVFRHGERVGGIGQLGLAAGIEAHDCHQGGKYHLFHIVLMSIQLFL